MLESEQTNSDPRIRQRFFEVLLRDDGIVWLRRLPVAYETLSDLHSAYDEFVAVVDDHLLSERIKSGELGTKVHTPMAWLYDVRDAPTNRNDPAFEAAIKERRPELLSRGALAVLVETATGLMQLSRMAAADNRSFVVVGDFAEAVTWLRDEMHGRDGHCE